MSQQGRNEARSGCRCRLQTPSACPGNPLLEWAVITLEENEESAQKACINPSNPTD